MRVNAAKQEAAVKRFRRYLEIHEMRSEKFPMAVTKFETTPTNHGTLWISAEVEHTSLGENSILRVLDHQYWNVAVGPRGQLTVWSCPKSLHQFAGGRAFGMKFRREVRSTYKPRISK